MLLDYLKQSLLVYLSLIFGLLISVYQGWSGFSMVNSLVQVEGDFSQPVLEEGRYPWTVRSVDTQVISKHWPDVTRETIQEQVGMLKSLGVNYIAVGTPYDRLDDLSLWAEEIHAAGLNVWYRSHWAEWEGDDGKPAIMTPEEYLRRTQKFIVANPELFEPGDSFTVAVEAEQVGIGLGKRFLNWDEYRAFLLAQITTANESFDEIGLKGKIHTNWLSVNGWVVDNQFTPELMDKVGLIVVDHFVGQSNTIGEEDDVDKIVDMTMADLDYYHNKWGVPILLGEWGYQIFQDVTEEKQALVIDKLMKKLVNKKYLVGVNYWVHMGNSAALIGDTYGANLEFRLGAYVLKNYFDPLGSIQVQESEKLDKLRAGEDGAWEDGLLVQIDY